MASPSSSWAAASRSWRSLRAAAPGGCRHASWRRVYLMNAYAATCHNPWRRGVTCRCCLCQCSGLSQCVRVICPALACDTAVAFPIRARARPNCRQVRSQLSQCILAMFRCVQEAVRRESRRRTSCAWTPARLSTFERPRARASEASVSSGSPSCIDTKGQRRRNSKVREQSQL